MLGGQCITLEGADGGRAIDHVQICAPKDRTAKAQRTDGCDASSPFLRHVERRQIQWVMRQVMGPDSETFGVKPLRMA